MSNIYILLAEPSFIVRKGLIATISEIPGIKMIMEVENKDQLREEIEKADPDYIIINPDLFDFGDCQVPLSYIPPKYRKKTIGLLSREKDCTAFQFPVVIYFQDNKSSIIEKLKKQFSSNSHTIKNRTDLEISNRERLVVKYIALGLTNKEIADKLFISAHTVITHRKNITRKLGIKTVSGLTIYAIMNNLIEIEEIK